jgi:hypothetical protein
MSRKEELRKMVSLLRLQANAASSRTAKQTFQKMADYYQREAEQLQVGVPRTSLTAATSRGAPRNRLHNYWGEPRAVPILFSVLARSFFLFSFYSYHGNV